MTGVRVEPGARRRHVAAVPVPGARRPGQRQRQLVVPGHRVQGFGQVGGPFQDHFLRERQKKNSYDRVDKLYD